MEFVVITYDSLKDRVLLGMDPFLQALPHFRGRQWVQTPVLTFYVVSVKWRQSLCRLITYE